MNLLFLDLETTGLDPVKNRIIEIGAKLVPDKPTEDPYLTKALKFKAVILFEPSAESPVSVGAMAVNGRSLSESFDGADKNVFTEDVAIENFANWLAAMKYKFREFVVVGHNVNFDISFLKETFKRNNLTGLEDVIGYRVLDVASVGLFAMYAGLVPGLTKPSNEELIKFFNLGKMFSTIHTATMDIEATEANLRRFVEIVKPAVPIQVTP